MVHAFLWQLLIVRLQIECLQVGATRKVAAVIVQEGLDMKEL